MRIQPIVGSKAWFGPRTLGWGWAPISWEGYVVLAAFIVIVLGYPVVFGGDHGELVALGATGGVLALCVLKGTSPGGPRRAAELERLSS